MGGCMKLMIRCLFGSIWFREVWGLYNVICYVCDGLAQFLVVRSTVVTWNETNDSL